MLPLLAASIALAGVPVVWVVCHRGPRRTPPREGALDGLALLMALACAAFALFMACVSTVRAADERRLAATATPVMARIERCYVTTSRSGGRIGGPSHSLSCDMRAGSGDADRVQRVVAGYPSGRQGYDEWMQDHLPGSSIELAMTTGPEARLTGFSQLVPATTTAVAAARDAFRFGMIAFALFVLSRGVVTARERAGRPLPS